MKRVGTFVHAGETPGGCHLNNQGYLLMKRAKRVKRQAPPVPQSIHVVAEGDPLDGHRSWGRLRRHYYPQPYPW